MASAEVQITTFAAELRSSLSSFAAAPSSLSPDLDAAVKTHILTPIRTEFEQVVKGIEKTVDSMVKDLDACSEDLMKTADKFRKATKKGYREIKYEQQAHVNKLEMMKKFLETYKVPEGVGPEMFQRVEKLESTMMGFDEQIKTIEEKVWSIAIESVVRESRSSLLVAMRNKKPASFTSLQLIFDSDIGDPETANIEQPLAGSDRIEVSVALPPRVRDGYRWVVHIGVLGKQGSNILEVPLFKPPK